MNFHPSNSALPDACLSSTNIVLTFEIPTALFKRKLLLIFDYWLIARGCRPQCREPTADFCIMARTQQNANYHLAQLAQVLSDFEFEDSELRIGFADDSTILLTESFSGWGDGQQCLLLGPRWRVLLPSQCGVGAELEEARDELGQPLRAIGRPVNTIPWLSNLNTLDLPTA